MAVCIRFKTELECISSSTPTLAALSKATNLQTIQLYIAQWIDSLQEFLNISRKMNEMQAIETALYIADEYYYLTVADVNLIFKRAKMGQFGQLYDRLDGQIILSWFESYAEGRANAAAMRTEQESMSYKDRDQRQGRSVSVEELAKEFTKRKY